MRRGRKPFVAIEHIKDFNELKAELKGKPFTKESFRDELKKRHIINNSIFWFSLVRFNLVKRVSREHFVFTNDKPIHFTLLDTVYMDYSNKLAKYNRTCEKKKAEEIKKAQISEAIKFLKNLGFHVYAPIGDLYSKL